MVVPLQCVQVRWNGRTQQHYLDRGYKFTKKNDLFWADVNDLPVNSGMYITILCDYCGEYFIRRYADYTRRKDMSLIEKDSCLSKECINSKKVEGHLLTYGVKYSIERESVKEKTRKTTLERYGVEHIFQAEDFQDMVRETSLEKYGTEHPMQSEEVKRKASETFQKNGEISTSKQQLEVFQMLKDAGYKVILNKSVSSFNLDVALYIDDIKIDVEYDGWYWHQDAQKDRRRDEVSKSLGWKILRIKGSKSLPDIETLIQKVEVLVNTSKEYEEIILEDWRRLSSSIK